MSRTRLGKFHIVTAVDDPLRQLQIVTLAGPASFRTPQFREVHRTEGGIHKSEAVLNGALLFTFPVSWSLLNENREAFKVGAALELEVDGEEVFIASMVAGSEQA